VWASAQRVDPSGLPRARLNAEAIKKLARSGRRSLKTMMDVASRALTQGVPVRPPIMTSDPSCNFAGISKPPIAQELNE